MDARRKSDFYVSKPAERCPTSGLKAVDLFCGAGGITLGLLNAGFDVRLAADVNVACEQTHKATFPRVPFFLGDISKSRPSELSEIAGIRPGELDLLCGGPPCQGFSIIGGREVDDPRNRLFKSFIGFAEHARPKAIVMENVPGMATLGQGDILEVIGRAFDRAGYTVSCAELLAAQYGVPQMRWRIFLIGWRKEDFAHMRFSGFPMPTHGSSRVGDLVPNRTISDEESCDFLTTRDAIGDLPPLQPGTSCDVYGGNPEGPYQTAMRHGLGNALYNHYAPKISEVNQTRIRSLKPGQDWRDMPRRLLPESMKRALRKDHTRRYRRMTWDGTPRSIITKFRDPKTGEYSHPEQDRTISIREAARVQSFPDWFRFYGSNSDIYEQVGNAVPPLLARAIGDAIAGVLTGAIKPSQTPPKSRYTVGKAQQMALFSP